MDADDWLRDILSEMESANVAPTSYVTFVAFHLKGSAAQWWESHRCTLPTGTVVTWQEFQLAFRAWHIPQGLMDQKKEEFLKLIQGKTTVVDYHRKFLYPDMLRMMYALTHASRGNFVKDYIPI